MVNSSKIIIMRHGQAEHNLLKIFNADPSHPNYKNYHLTSEGKQQIKQNATKIKKSILGPNNPPIYQILHSPLTRAEETAQVLAASLDQSMEIIKSAKDLIEVNAGDLEGQPFNTIQTSDWELDELHRHGGESEEELTVRLYNFLNELIQKNQFANSGHIILVTHGSPAKVLIKILTGFPVRLDTACYAALQLSEIPYRLKHTHILAEQAKKREPDIIISNHLKMYSLNYAQQYWNLIND